MIVSLGDAVVDLVAVGLDSLPQWGEDREASSIETQLGGSALHVATNLAALGNEVGLLAGVGRDQWGRFLVQGARDAGVLVSGVKELDVPTAVTMVLSGRDDRAFVSTYGATAAYSRDDLDREVLERAAHLHVTGIWQSRTLQPHLVDLLRTLRTRGVTVSLDTQYDPESRWAGPLLDLLEVVDLFLPHEVEATGISGKERPEEALAWLGEHVPLVAMKRGAAGAMVQHGEELYVMGAFAVQVVDTTGAGDAFAAGFLHGWLQGWPIERTLRFANATGALAVTRVGASEDPPTEEEVMDFIEQQR
ncbi:MAG: sugar kinase [Chloroflexota bacterium]|nr:sugar kinase [Chloroflexota bacterium]